ncbi:Nucleotide-binding oligomerization domain-containing protein 1 [Labeo rohita]|uniref:Nucleotide-binding oligomerization domain-containing protein 1 n=1 Tax=Labeo rohita TaxID=84645 RepID=A0ABQ8MSY7_LABRO|nr:Nucleotide-binding oligomerization domain-containing protein 1 [Labeo rohita]
MASAQQSATEYLRNARKNLVNNLKNLPVIIENLYQKNVFNDHEVDALKAEKTEFDKVRSILDWVINKGEMASYELLRILDVTQKRTLSSNLRYWISCFPFRWEDTEASYSFGTRPCQIYQTQLKMKAKCILRNQREGFRKYLDDKAQGQFSFIPLVLETDSVMKTQFKIKLKNKKSKKLRPKKLRAYIPHEEQALSPEDLLKWQDKNILIIGKPGVGKTTVVQEMLCCWAEKDGRELDYMFYFDENVLAFSSSAANLKSILFDVYLKPMDKDRKDVFQDIEENSENVVIVFDGVIDLEENSILWKIMNHELLPDAKIVITCRSEVEDDPLFSVCPTRKVYVQGFSEESINTYYQSMLGHDPVLLDVILKNQELFSLSHVPLYAFMIVDLIKFKNDTVCNQPQTVTEMYIHIFRLAVPEKMKDQVHPLMENAFNATMQKCLTLPDISCDEKNICHAFLKIITTTDSPTSATTYCAFLHNTMQEFFSALWLLGHPEEIEKVLQCCQTEEHKHMRHVLPFLCGLLGEHSIKFLKCLFSEDQIKKTSDWFIEKFLDTFLQPQSEEFDLLYVCQCLYELQSPKACLMLLKKMDHQLETEVDLDPHQCCALSYIISQSRDEEVYLNLEDCNVTDVGMNMMLSCSPNIRLKTCKEPLKQITFFLEFFHTTECRCRFFDVRQRYNSEKCSALLDLYSHVKDYETQTGRNFLPALQSVFQSVPDDWIIDLSQRKSSVLLEVLKLQTEKKPVELRGCSEEETEMMSFLQCLPYISQLRLSNLNENIQSRFLLSLFIKAAEIETQTGEQMLKLLTSVCKYSSFSYGWTGSIDQSDFLLDLYSHVKNYETQTGRSFLPALQSVFQSPDVWIIDLSQRKSSVLLEVLKLQTEKKPVKLRGCSEEETEMMSFLQCLPYISQLRFSNLSESIKNRFLLSLFIKGAEIETQTGEQMLKLTMRLKQAGVSFQHYSQFSSYVPDVLIIDLSQFWLKELRSPPGSAETTNKRRNQFSNLSESIKNRFLLSLFIKAAEIETQTGEQMLKLLTSVCNYSSFHYGWTGSVDQSDFLLDLYSHVKNYETQTGRSFLPALQSVFQSPDVWIIDLSQRKSSVLLEVLKLQTKKKPVKLRGCSEEESEMMSFLQCLPYISQLRFWLSNKDMWMSAIRFLLSLSAAAVRNDTVTGTIFSTMLSFVCSYETFPFDEECDEYSANDQSDFLLDLYSHVKDYETRTGRSFLPALQSNYETQTGRSFLPALQSVFQSPDVWIIDLSQRKSSVLLEVLKLQTKKKPVELRGCSEEESEMMSFLQCLPYISQLRMQMSGIRFLLSLSAAAVRIDTVTGTRFSTMLSFVCSYKTFPFHEEFDKYIADDQSDFLLDLYSHVKNYETQTGRSFLPALQSVFQSPDVWIIDLSQRKSSVLLEVLKLQTKKKPVELRGCSEEETEMMSFLQCLPYISQLRFCFYHDEEMQMSGIRFLLSLSAAAVRIDTVTGTIFSTMLSFVCSYKTFPFHEECNEYNAEDQSDFLLDLYSHVKNYETQTGRSFLPALQSVFQSPDVWIIDLSQRKSSVLLEVLKLQTEKKQVQLRGCSEEESEMMSFLQCLPYISQLRPSKETLQKLVECVCEAQEEELTQCFLQKVGGGSDFLTQIQLIAVDFRKSNIKCSISEILPFLNRIHFKRMSSSFMLSVIREIHESGSVGFVSSLLSSVENFINLQSRELDSVHCAALRFTLQHCTAVSLNLQWTSIPEEELKSILPLFTHVSHLSVDRLLLLKMLYCCSVSDVQQEAAAVLLIVLQHKLDFSCRSAVDLTTNTDSETLHLTTDDCRVMSRVIQRAHSDTKIQLILHDCEINRAGIYQLFPVCDKSLLLQFLAHVRPEEAESLSQALGEELDLSQTQLDPQVCRGLVLILEYSEGLTELDLSQCRLTDDSLNLLLPNLHKAQNIDFSGNGITDVGALKIYFIVTLKSNIKTVRLDGY